MQKKGIFSLYNQYANHYEKTWRTLLSYGSELQSWYHFDEWRLELNGKQWSQLWIINSIRDTHSKLHITLQRFTIVWVCVCVLFTNERTRCEERLNILNSNDAGSFCTLRIHSMLFAPETPTESLRNVLSSVLSLSSNWLKITPTANWEGIDCWCCFMRSRFEWVLIKKVIVLCPFPLPVLSLSIGRLLNSSVEFIC